MDQSNNNNNDGLLTTTLGIKPVSIELEMQRSYLDYAMSVIVSRAIPDVRDGLKPVHRRIFYAMNEIGCDYNRAYKKSARIVGDVMGKYHPHGDGAIYDALVRMAQDFSIRVPLIDGQGNFGSIDDDPPAAMRYTEVRLARIAHDLLEDIDKNTVTFQENYDGSEREPTVLPAAFPNILVNGSEGIAVGMATSIPTHNLGEVIDATLAYIDNPKITAIEMMDYIKGPDFPTAGIIVGRHGIRDMITTGRGSVTIRGKAEIEQIKNRDVIIVTEIPYQVVKSRLIEKIAMLVKEKKIEGISDIRDESNKKGIRIVIELKKDVSGNVILNQLYKITPLQSSFSTNMLSLYKGKPQLMNVQQVIAAFVEFRQEIVSRRVAFMLAKARNRAHIVIGLCAAVDNIDEVIKIIRGSANQDEAKERLLAKQWPADKVANLIQLVADRKNNITDGQFTFTAEQVRAILDMRLSKLTGLERDDLVKEINTLAGEISEFLAILASKERILAIIKEELTRIKDQFATPRLTAIEDGEEMGMDMDDLIQREDIIVTITLNGYIKRSPLSSYNAQRRGGKGKVAMKTQDDDNIIEIFGASTHSHILFFSSKGQVYRLKGYQLPIGTLQSKGRYIMQLLPLESDEKITSFLVLPENKKEWNGLNLMFATTMGNIRRSSIDEFENINRAGKIAIRLDEGDDLVAVKLAKDDDHVLLATRQGMALRFPVSAARVIKSRTSSGVIGINLEADDRVISSSILADGHREIEVRDKYLSIPVKDRLKITELLKAIKASEKSVDVEKEEVDLFAAGTPAVSKEELQKQLEKLLASGAKAAELDATIVEQLAASEEFLLTITEKGYGKRTSTYEYRITNRGGKGIKNIITSPRNGTVMASFVVHEGENIILITEAGQSIRCRVNDISIFGRNTQGVKIFSIAAGDKVVSSARVAGAEDEEEAVESVEANVVPLAVEE